jgi:hypothetical protein
MVHTTSHGQIISCRVNPLLCTFAPAVDHFPTIRAARNALALDELELQCDYQLPLPAGWGHFLLEEPLAS